MNMKIVIFDFENRVLLHRMVPCLHKFKTQNMFQSKTHALVFINLPYDQRSHAFIISKKMPLFHHNDMNAFQHAGMPACLR